MSAAVHFFVGFVVEEEVETRKEKGEGRNEGRSLLFRLFFSSSLRVPVGGSTFLTNMKMAFSGEICHFLLLSLFFWWERNKEAKKKVNEKKASLGVFLLSHLVLPSFSHLDPLPDDVAKVSHGQVRRDQVPVILFFGGDGKKEERAKGQGELLKGEEENKMISLSFPLSLSHLFTTKRTFSCRCPGCQTCPPSRRSPGIESASFWIWFWFWWWWCVRACVSE